MSLYQTCSHIASEQKLDEITSKNTAFNNFVEFVTTNYWPTICFKKEINKDKELLCNAWDAAQSHPLSYSNKNQRATKINRCCFK